MIAESDGNGLAGEGDTEGKDEEVGCVREEVGCYDDGKGRVDDARKVA